VTEIATKTFEDKKAGEGSSLSKYQTRAACGGNRGKNEWAENLFVCFITTPEIGGTLRLFERLLHIRAKPAAKEQETKQNSDRGGDAMTQKTRKAERKKNALALSGMDQVGLLDEQEGREKKERDNRMSPLGGVETEARQTILMNTQVGKPGCWRSR